MKETDLGSEFHTILDEASQHLTHKQISSVKETLTDFKDIFAFEGEPLGRTNLVQHTIDTGTAKPVRQRPRRVPIHLQDTVKEIEKTMTRNVIEPSMSPWAAPVVLVRKKDNSYRFCVDYRLLNEVTRKYAYPLPRIDENLEAIHGSTWFSTMDMASDYWQVEVDPQDRPKTAFCTRHGLFQWRVMPFGLCNAPLKDSWNRY